MECSSGLLRCFVMSDILKGYEVLILLENNTDGLKAKELSTLLKNEEGLKENTMYNKVLCFLKLLFKYQLVIPSISKRNINWYITLKGKNAVKLLENCKDSYTSESNYHQETLDRFFLESGDLDV